MLRRQFIQALALGLLGTGSSESSTLAPDLSADISLRDLAKARGLLFGSAYDLSAIKDPAYGELLKRQAGILVTDYSLKFKPLRRNGFEANFETADTLVDFASSNNIPVRGHCLIWNEFNPEWLTKLDRPARRYWLERHIVEVLEHYSGRMHSWDVVNEPFWPGHKLKGGYRNGPWFDAFEGESYIKEAFKVAHGVDKNLPLVLNEAWVERDDKLGEQVRGGLIQLLRYLFESDAKVSAVGLQCHLRPKVSVSLNRLSEFIDQLKEFPVDVYITELDIDDEGLGEEVDKLVADMYFDFMKLIRQKSNVKVVTTWQLSDKYSFYKDKYKRPIRGMLFDELMQPKLASRSFAKSLLMASDGK